MLGSLHIYCCFSRSIARASPAAHSVHRHAARPPARGYTATARSARSARSGASGAHCERGGCFPKHLMIAGWRVGFDAFVGPMPFDSGRLPAAPRCLHAPPAARGPSTWLSLPRAAWRALAMGQVPPPPPFPALLQHPLTNSQVCDKYLDVGDGVDSGRVHAGARRPVVVVHASVWTRRREKGGRQAGVAARGRGGSAAGPRLARGWGRVISFGLLVLAGRGAGEGGIRIGATQSYIHSHTGSTTWTCASPTLRCTVWRRARLRPCSKNSDECLGVRRHMACSTRTSMGPRRSEGRVRPRAADANVGRDTFPDQPFALQIERRQHSHPRVAVILHWPDYPRTRVF